MKVLHIYREKNKGDIGGVEHHVQYVIVEQLRLGLTPCVLSFAFGKKDSFTKEIRKDIVWYHLRIRKNLIVRFLLNSSKLVSKTGFFTSTLERIIQNFILKKKLEKINEIHPDIIHQHDYLSSIRLSNRLSKNYKIIFTNHYGEYLYLKKTRLINYIQQSFLLSSFDAIIASSKELLPDMDHCYQISNGVETSVFPKISKEEKKHLKSKFKLEDKITILCARRWAPTKGIIHFALALNHLDKDIQEKIIVLFAGNESDDYYEYKCQVKAELDTCSNIDMRFLGNLPHNRLSEYVNASDIGVIPSLMEGVSLFSIELLSCGIPVLATNVGGNPEIIIEDNNGWLVPPKSATALAEKITNIVTGWPATNLIIDTGAIRKSHSWNRITKQIINIYSK
jgi:glycosyltransferase involved in cell wall biosynthesis